MAYKKTILAGLTAATVLASTTASSLALEAQPLQIAANGNLHMATYMSGGVGDTDQLDMKLQEGAYNLKVIAAYDTGHYLANVAMMVTNKNGDVVINTVTDGPWFYADLEAGTYTVTGLHNGVMKRQNITIGEKTNLREIVLRWDAPAGEVITG
ncbi:MAG: hypothetical protein MRY32_06230 [Rickettsiales bacterium]|nr:hypothetical protein [Rickettsiales bacterium]